MNNESVLQKGSPDRFGHSWNIYNEILPIHEEQFLRWTTGIEKSWWKGKTVLDVGCGIGRNSYWPLTYGAKESLSIDVDERTLAAAKRNLSTYSNAQVVHRSAYEINETDRFDMVFSIGVIHHLANPELAVANMVKAAKPGGKVLVWLYGYENNEWIVKYFNPMRKALFSKMPLAFVHTLSLPLTGLLWLTIRAGMGKSEYFKMLKGFSFNHLRAIVYDHMLPEIALYYTRTEAQHLLKAAGLNHVETNPVNDISWAVIGTKPEKE